MASCSSAEDCSDHGDCVDSHCECDFAWFGASCSESGRETWGHFWTVCIALTSTSFALLSLAAGYKLHRQFRDHKAIGAKRLLHRLFRTPKYQTLAMLTVIGALRTVWLLLDPHNFREILSRLGDRLLYLLISPLVFLIYCFVILVWHGICRGIGIISALTKPWVRVLVYIEMAAAMPLVLLLAAVQGLRCDWEEVKFTVAALCSVGVASVIVLVAVYARLIQRYMSAGCGEEDSVEFQKEKVVETRRTEITQERELEAPSFSGDLGCESRHVCHEALSIDSKDFGHYPRSCHECWSSFESREPSARLYVPRPSSPLSQDNTPLTLILTPEDKIALRQIIMLSALSGLIGVAGIVLTLVFSWLPLDATTAFLADVCSFCMELFACASVLILFTTEIRVASKQNLQFMVELSLRFKSSPPRVSLPSDLPLISERLRQFLGQ